VYESMCMYNRHMFMITVYILQMGNQEMAEKRSKETRQLSIVGVLVGVLVYIVYIIVHVYVIKPESSKN